MENCRLKTIANALKGGWVVVVLPENDLHIAQFDMCYYDADWTSN